MAGSPFDIELEVGDVIDTEPFPEAEMPKLSKSRIDLGDDEIQFAAQLESNYDAADLVGRQVLY